MKYYKPKAEDLQIGLNIEFYAEGTWHPHVIEVLKGWWKYLEDGDIRVKYLDSLDFNTLNYNLKKIWLKEIEVIIGFDDEDNEIKGKEDVYDEETLLILKNSVSVGKFYPFSSTENVEYGGKKCLIKNLSELRKILK